MSYYCWTCCRNSPESLSCLLGPVKSCLHKNTNKLNQKLTLLTARLHDNPSVSRAWRYVHCSHASPICNQHIPSISECTKLQWEFTPINMKHWSPQLVKETLVTFSPKKTGWFYAHGFSEDDKKHVKWDDLGDMDVKKTIKTADSHRLDGPHHWLGQVQVLRYKKPQGQGKYI